MKLKLGKLFLRINSWVSGYDSHKEKKLAVSEDHKPYIRAKRNIHNLPDGYTRTRWIKKIKNWKYRSKVGHQWEKHKVTYYEQDKYDPDENAKAEILYQLSKLKKDEWLYIDSGSEFHYYALKMVMNNEIEGYFTCTKNEFDNFGIKEVTYRVILTHIRNKLSNL